MYEKTFRRFASALCLAFSGLAQAQQYKWVDQNGKVHTAMCRRPG